MPEVMEIEERKRWAIGMSQVQFENEFMIRYPIADAIPDLNKWLGLPKPENRLIDSVRLEDIQSEDMTKKQEKEVSAEKENKKKPIYCGGCNQVFDHPISKWALKKNHEKHCMAYKNKKEMEG